MSMEKPQPRPAPEGCVTAFVRIPVRLVVLLVVVPVRMVWDLLAAGGRFLERAVWRPLARGLGWLGGRLAVPLLWLGRQVLAPFLRGLGIAALWLAKAVCVWPWVGLWRYVLVPAVRYGLVLPARWAYRWILAPVGRGLAFLAAGLWRYGVLPLARYGFAIPAGWLYATVLTPLGHGIAWLLTGIGRGLGVLAKAVFVWPWVGLWRYVLVPAVRYGFVLPLGLLWRYVLVPVGREVVGALRVGWRIAGFVSRAVGRALARAAWHLLGRPAVLIYRTVCAPVGRLLRDGVWAPARKAASEARRAARAAFGSARASVRQARRDAWYALVGGARTTEPGEPAVAQARTLGSTATASGAAPAPEISPRQRG
ncbi:hypothetical protein [Streptomyces sp. NPDC008121]|uniref:hypothetical protein n=1 Tax=Streptomyces sp. NPDC008121 TaxID=3364809 RepID=UPI0036F1920F